MRQNLFYTLLFLFITSSLLAEDIVLSEADNRFSVTEKSYTSFSFINHLHKIKTRVVKTEFGDFTQLILPSYAKNSEIGSPELPVLRQLIQVPNGADIDIEVLKIKEETIDLTENGFNLPIFPLQPSISKGDNAQEAPFYYNESRYQIDSFGQEQYVSTEYLGKMRGQQLARLNISPIKYNPLSNELKVVTSLEVRIVFKNSNITENSLEIQRYYSPEFQNLYKKCINYLPPSSKDVITTYPVKYVIVSDPSFQTALQPLIEWKTKKGFIVVEAYTNDPNVGNTTASIHNFIKDLYVNASPTNPAPTYLLIVGDEAQVPSFNGITSSHLSDMYYCEFDGNGDFYPEMYYGRMSATNSGDVEAQVHKTITHETYSFNDPSFLENIVLVAGVDASMAPTYGNGQINYGTDYYFNTAHGLTIHNYLYGSGTPITTDMPQAAAAIISDISDGSSFSNYTAHCGSSGWADPSFTTSDVPALQNIDKYGVMIGNCCQSNDFNVPECFGEAVLRANNKGAVGYIGGSNNTYWDEDYWWAVGNTANISANPTYSGTDLGVYDCLMHENGEYKDDWFITQGQIIHSGNMAVTQAAGSEHYYWEIYHVMGDPSLMPYIGIPTQLTVSHIAATPVGTSTLTVNTEESAYVAISMNGVLLDAKLADSTGIVNLSFTPISNVGSADIVVTKQFKQPYISTIQIISPNGPFVVYHNHSIDDAAGNNNGLADYNELIYLDVDFQNIGTVNSQNIDIVISTNDPYVTMIDSVAVIALLNPAQTTATNSPFSFQVANYITDLHTVLFNITITDNNMNVWYGNLNIILNAPVLDYNSFLIDDGVAGNGKLDAGETVNVIVNIGNSGHASIDNLNATLSSPSPFITINNPVNFPVSLLNNNQQQNTSFSVSVDPNTPVGTMVDLNFDFTDGTYTLQNIFTEIVGLIDEDYESGNFSQYTWIQGQFPWSIDSIQIYEGIYSSRSAIGLPDNEESELSVTLDVIAPGDITFYKFVSSEQDYDELKFKINGNKVGEWSGIDVSWSLASFPVNVGQNTFKWEYEKDASVADGQDGAWIDYIVFPPISSTTNPSGNNYQEIDFKIYPNPTMGSFSIVFNDNKKRIINIIDPIGKKIESVEVNDSEINFDISNYQAGMYQITITPDNITYLISKQ